MKALVVVVKASTFLGTSNGHMLPIQGSKGMRYVPPPSEDSFFVHPVLWVGGAGQHFIAVLSDNRITDFRDKFVDGRPGHSEGILQ